MGETVWIFAVFRGHFRSFAGFYGLLRAFMVFYRFLWAFSGFHGLLQALTVFTGFTVFCGFFTVLVGFYGFLRAFTFFCGLSRFYGLLRSFAGSYRIYRVDCGLLWLFVGFRGLQGYMGPFIYRSFKICPQNLNFCFLRYFPKKHKKWKSQFPQNSTKNCWIW